MKQLIKSIRGCERCNLSASMPGTCPVPGVGSPKAKIMIVGEALGEDESLLEEPFIGKCGKFLDTLFAKAGMERKKLYITNTVKCRPTKSKKGSKRISNRPPTESEINSCKIWLWKELQEVEPDVILTLGKVATYNLLSSQLKKSFSLSKVSGVKHTVDYTKAVIVPAPHPSWLMLHGKAMVDKTIEILKEVQNEYGEVSKSGD